MTEIDHCSDRDQPNPVEGSNLGTSGSIATNTVAFNVVLGCGTPCGTVTTPYLQVLDRQNGSTISLSYVVDSNLSATLGYTVWDYTVSGTMILPVNSNSSDPLGLEVHGGSDIYGGGIFAPSNLFRGTGDLRIGGARFYNSAGTALLSGVTLQSDSGFDYSRSLAAPEPSTFGLIASAIVALAMRSKPSSRRLKKSA